MANKINLDGFSVLDVYSILHGIGTDLDQRKMALVSEAEANADPALLIFGTESTDLIDADQRVRRLRDLMKRILGQLDEQQMSYGKDWLQKRFLQKPVEIKQSPT